MKDQRRYFSHEKSVYDRNTGLPSPMHAFKVADAWSIRAAKLIANALNIYKVRKVRKVHRSKPAEKRS
jgi:hypothetical protein